MAFTTHKSMILSLGKGDDISWAVFEENYRPLILLRAKDRGLKHEEQEELLADVLLSLFKGKDSFVYNPEKGKFRSYLRTICDRASFKIIKKRSEDVSLNTSDDIEFVSANNDLEQHWEDAWRQKVLSEAMELVKPEVSEKTLTIFELFVLEGYSAKQVSKILGVTEENVYVAKHRVFKRLKQIIKKLEDI